MHPRRGHNTAPPQRYAPSVTRDALMPPHDQPRGRSDHRPAARLARGRLWLDTDELLACSQRLLESRSHNRGGDETLEQYSKNASAAHVLEHMPGTSSNIGRRLLQNSPPRGSLDRRPDHTSTFLEKCAQMTLRRAGA